MGSWFSNLNIRRSGTVTVEAAVQALGRILVEWGYEAAESAEDADGVLALLAREDSEWFTVCTELLPLEEPEQFASLGNALSGALHTDILGIGCFDSDYLWLNLLNTDEKIDGWVGIGNGKELGFSRRNKLTPWKKKVWDYARFAQCAREEHVVADGFLLETADCLGLPREQSGMGVRYLQEAAPEWLAARLYFRQQEALQVTEQVELGHYENSLPCLAGYENHLSALSLGASGTGLRIWFLVPGGESDEVVFENVRLLRDQRLESIELIWDHMPDGRWAWCWHDPAFAVLPAVKGRMTREKRQALEQQRRFTIHFTPRGNNRKMLDIQIGFVPDENPEGGTWWNVWKKYGTREEFIRHHNRIWKWCWSMKDPEDDERGYLPLLKREDFD
jgi:hypothetical protein